MTRDELFNKFDNDVKKRSRFSRFLLSLDQMGNVLFWNGSQDETISSNIGRKIESNTATWFDKLVCTMLKRFESSHCYRSTGE